MHRRKLIAIVISILLLNMVIFNPIKALAINNDNEITKEKEIENENVITDEKNDSHKVLEENDSNNANKSNSDKSDKDKNDTDESMVNENGLIDEKNEASNVTEDVEDDKKDKVDLEDDKNEKDDVEDSKKDKNDSDNNEIISNMKAATNNVERSISKKADMKPEVEYEVKVQNEGWQEKKRNEELAGTTGKGLKLEAIKLNLLNLEGVSLKYQAHIQNIGWQSWKHDGEVAGDENRSLRIEAIRIQLESTDNYSIMYRVHIQNIGWQSWKSDGEMAGTEGQSLRIEAIEIKIVDKIKRAQISIETPKEGSTISGKESIEISGWKVSNISNSKLNIYMDDSLIDEEKYTYSTRNDVLNGLYGYGTTHENVKPGFKCVIGTNGLTSGKHTVKAIVLDSEGNVLKDESISFTYNSFYITYRAHVQNIGWQDYVENNELAGTEGKALRLEALKINLINAPNNARIKYRAHVQDIGWQDWKYDDNIAGTVGQSLRIEAIQIELEHMEDLTVEYQVHVQDYGWTQWCIDGEIAGTIGKSKRAEAIRIRLVPKYKRQYFGIDVSTYNGNVNWQAVKNAGVDFAMIRVGYRGYGAAGNFANDSRFEKNINEAKSVGLKVGIYFVTQAVNENEAVEEANWVIERIKNYNIDYPVAMDVEYSSESGHNGRADHLDKDTRTRVIKTFCEKIERAGYVPIIYLNVDWAKNFVNMSQLTAYDTWIANYKNNPNGKPSYSGSYTIWQYTSTGTVNGVNGVVDCNICYKKY